MCHWWNKNYFFFSGTLSIHTPSQIISQPYPTGQRTIESATNPSQCTICDPGAPTEQCFPNLGVCAKLSNMAISIIGNDGTVRAQKPLDTSCMPRYLQGLKSAGVHLSVDCQNSCFQLASITSSTILLHEQQCNPGESVSGIVVEGSYLHGDTVYDVEIDRNAVFRSAPLIGSGDADITPNHDCTNFIALFPLYTRDKFMLWCNASTIKHLYIVDVDEDIFPESTPNVALSSAPLSSPNGQTFAAVSVTTLRLYNTDRLTTQPPGARDFGARILLHTYLDNNTILVFLEGERQILVNVDLFIDSSGTQGITTLSYGSTVATVHKLIAPGVYATWNKTGSLFNLLLFDTSNGQLLRVIPNLQEKPIDVFFQQSTVLPTTVPARTTQSSSDFPSIPTPTLTSGASLAATSTLPSPTHSTVPTQQPTTPTSGTTELPRTSNTVIIPIIATLIILFMVVVIIVFLFLLRYSKLKWLSRVLRKFKNACITTTGPVAEETQMEEANKSSSDNLSSDNLSSGRATACATPNSSWSNASINPFTETVSQSTFTSDYGSGGYDVPFKSPIAESNSPL